MEDFLIVTTGVDHASGFARIVTSQKARCLERMTCTRCSGDVPEDGVGEVTCPKCGALQPNPAWTRPFVQPGAPTLESRKSDQGSLSGEKKYALVILNGEEPGRVVPLEKPRVVIGRADCDIVLSDPELSRQHVLIAINGMNARLEDLGSTNGTFVDGKRIQVSELTDRSEFRIGSHELVFVMRDRDENSA